MTNASTHGTRWNVAVMWRLAVTVVSILVVETIVCGLAVLPVVLLWLELTARIPFSPAGRAVVFGMLLVPSYVAFALCLMGTSALATRVTGARTPPNAEVRIADMGWPLMRWARYMVASHLVRVLAGSLFRGSPVWTVYLRLNGARIGRRVYVNSLFVSDHNLLEIGNDVVVGSEVHMSGHTVEAGVVKTALVRVGHDVTIGLGAVIDIGVTIGPRSQVGALSLVPKYTTLDADAVYAGIPVRRIDSRPTIET
jgi:acetyltransferase-like isoleucine patch superfamily enzyme